VNRWLVVAIGLGVAGTAAFVLLTSRPAAGPASNAHHEIGEESREKMRDLLRDADGGNR
jgi:hypothetical protein